MTMIGKSWDTRTATCPSVTFQSQISLQLTWFRTRASKIMAQRLKFWATAGPLAITRHFYSIFPSAAVTKEFLLILSVRGGHCDNSCRAPRNLATPVCDHTNILFLCFLVSVEKQCGLTRLTLSYLGFHNSCSKFLLAWTAFQIVSPFPLILLATFLTTCPYHPM